MATVSIGNAAAKMPLVGKGLWKVAPESAAETVYNAVKAGYRLFDGAADYGNEKECGDGITRALKEGIVKREELFIVSKLWNTNHAAKNVAPALKKSLADWQVDYFDLYLIHFPIALKYVDPATLYPPAWWHGAEQKPENVELENSPYEQTWHAMEAQQKAGLAKNIGVSNVAGSLMCDIMRYAEIKPAVLQIEHHPYLTQQPMIDFCKELGIAVTAYSSFGPQSFYELGMAGGVDPLLKHATIQSIADKHKKTTAEVLLRWATQRGIAVIPKSNDAGRLAANLNHTSFDLAPEDIKEISGLNKNLRFNDPAGINPLCAIFA